MQSKAAHGKASELKVAARLLESGFEVYVPLVDCGVDMVVRRRSPRDTGYIELQVKSAEKLTQFRGVPEPSSKPGWRLILHLRASSGGEKFYVLRRGQYKVTQEHCIKDATTVLKDREVALEFLPDALERTRG